MAQKIHGDLEVTGDLTVGGSAPGGGMTLLVELTLNALGPSWGTQAPSLGQVMSVSLTPTEVSDESGLWSNHKFTAPDDGVYVFEMESICVGKPVGTMLHGGVVDSVGIRVNETVDYVASADSHRRSPGLGTVPFGKFEGLAIAVKLSSGDTIQFIVVGNQGSIVSFHALSAHYRTHFGPANAKVRIYKR